MKTAYRYVAWNRENKVERGTLGAEDKADASQNLRERGYRPISIEEQGTIFDVGNWFKGKPPERLGFFRAFAALAQAGSSLDDTFQLLVQQSRTDHRLGPLTKLRMKITGGGGKGSKSKQRFLSAIEGVGQEVMSGTKLQEAMARRPEIFTEIESQMVQIGDEAGTMPHVLSEVSQFLERDRKFGKSLKDAMVYPAIVLSFAILMIIYMITSLIPQFASLYAGFGVDLPLTMKVMLGIATAFKTPWIDLMIIFVFLGGGYGFVRALGTTKGAMIFDKFRLSLPVIGELIEKVIVARLCRVLSMLFEAGKNPLRALEICIPVTESPVYAGAMTEARDLFRRGQVANVHEALVRTGAFEPLLTGFVLVGVKAGNTGEMLAKIASYYEDDIESLTAMIPTVVQTLVTILLGFMVGIIVYSVYVPMSQLITNIH